MMPEWLSGVGNGEGVHIGTVVVHLLLALVLGAAAALLYSLTHRKDENVAWSFVTTLVLLSVLLAMVTQVIGDNVARAFSLVGALSIVRFRTVVEDTRDTAFVIFSVVMGMAVGAGRLEVALTGLVVVGLASLIMRSRRVSNNGLVAGAKNTTGPLWTLEVRIGLTDTPEKLLSPLLDRHFLEAQLISAENGRQGAALNLAYKVRLKPEASPAAIVADLNLVDGVQSVEMRIG